MLTNRLDAGSADRAAGRYLPELVYGANDGIVTTFAVVSGVTGADLDAGIVLVLGIANLFADGFSMGMSSYLSRRSEIDYDRSTGDDREAGGSRPRRPPWPPSGRSSSPGGCR